jgi:Fe-S oxidoreductase
VHQFFWGRQTVTPHPPRLRRLVHDAVGDEALWSCLTCAVCLDACPVEINHIDSIVDMRRFLTLEEASTPDTAQSALQSIEQRGHPWRGTTLTRTSWMDGLDIPTLAEKSGRLPITIRAISDDTTASSGPLGK